MIWSANSYFGLLRQATHSHTDRVQLARILRQRWQAVNWAITKTFQRLCWRKHGTDMPL